MLTGRRGPRGLKPRFRCSRVLELGHAVREVDDVVEAEVQEPQVAQLVYRLGKGGERVACHAQLLQRRHVVHAGRQLLELVLAEVKVQQLHAAEGAGKTGDQVVGQVQQLQVLELGEALHGRHVLAVEAVEGQVQDPQAGGERVPHHVVDIVEGGVEDHQVGQPHDEFVQTVQPVMTHVCHVQVRQRCDLRENFRGRQSEGKPSVCLSVCLFAVVPDSRTQ